MTTVTADDWTATWQPMLDAVGTDLSKGRIVRAAEHDSGAFVDPGLNVGLHAILLTLCDKRSDVGGLVGRVTDL